MRPLISIITVTYNAADTLPTTIDSVAEQSFCDYEYIIMDGASKDSTVEIANKSAIRNLRIVSEPDNGLYDAMNKAMNIACGRYYIFLNAGDAFHSRETLRLIADAIIDNDFPGIVYGQTQLVDADRHRIADRHLTAPVKLSFRSFADGMSVCHQAFIASSDIVSAYDTSYKFSADYDWCIKCLKKSDCNVYIDALIIDYLYEGLTTANRKASLIERYGIMRKYYGTVPTLLRHLKFLPRYLYRRHIERKAVAAKK